MLECRRTFSIHTYTDRLKIGTAVRQSHTKWTNRCKWLLRRREIGGMASCCANRRNCQSKCSGGPCVPRTAYTGSSDVCEAASRYCKIHRFAGTFPSRALFLESASSSVKSLQLDPRRLSPSMPPRSLEALITIANLISLSLTNHR